MLTHFFSFAWMIGFDTVYLKHIIIIIIIEQLYKLSLRQIDHYTSQKRKKKKKKKKECYQILTLSYYHKNSWRFISAKHAIREKIIKKRVENIKKNICFTDSTPSCQHYYYSFIPDRPYRNFRTSKIEFWDFRIAECLAGNLCCSLWFTLNRGQKRQLSNI